MYICIYIYIQIRTFLEVYRPASIVCRGPEDKNPVVVDGVKGKGKPCLETGALRKSSRSLGKLH